MFLCFMLYVLYKYIIASLYKIYESLLDCSLEEEKDTVYFISGATLVHGFMSEMKELSNNER